MQITDFSKGKIWGIVPSALDAMLQQYGDVLRSESLSAGLARFTAEPEERDEFLLRDGVAIIPVTGPIFKRGGFWSYLYGGTPLSVLNQVFMDAQEDPAVEAIVLDIDSPGGTVSGTEAFGDVVFESRDNKPVVAFGNGMMASAAYWIGSGADRVVVESTADVGSIGVVMVHWDWSKEDEKMGLKRTVLSAGKYKAIGNDAEPLSDLARETFQSELDYIYSIFVDTVARNRDTDPETVLQNMADGRIFIGRQAVEAGLADAVGGMATAIDMARELADRRKPQSPLIFIHP